MTPVVDGPEGIDNSRAFGRFDVTVLIGASHLHHVFLSHVMPVVDGPEGIKNGKKGIWEI